MSERARTTHLKKECAVITLSPSRSSRVQCITTIASCRLLSLSLLYKTSFYSPFVYLIILFAFSIIAFSPPAFLFVCVWSSVFRFLLSVCLCSEERVCLFVVVVVSFSPFELWEAWQGLRVYQRWLDRQL